MTTVTDFVPGHVEPGGPSAVWHPAGAEIRKASVSPQDNNAYLFIDSSSGARLLIDAADDAGRLRELIGEPGVAGELIGICTTHQHWDHHRALADLAASGGVTTLAGADDADALPVVVDRELQHGDTVAVGAQRLEVIALRGHTPGSVALAWQEPGDGQVHLFTGDSLFPGGVGKTDTPEDFTSLLGDVRSRIFDRYGDDSVVYPGHGDNTTLGAERPHLEQWRERGW